MNRTARIMSPPRRPRGESPKTTIRVLQTQIRTMTGIIAELRNSWAESCKQIARQDIELSEAQDFDRENCRLRDELQNLRYRSQFLEGYFYAKSTDDPAKTNPRSGEGDIRSYFDGAQAREGSREKTYVERGDGAARDEIQRFGPDHPTYRHPRPVGDDPWLAA